MGNSHCVPQPPRRLRASFSRKPSLKGNREDSARKLAGLFGTEARPDGDTAANKIFHYIPGTDILGPENHPENLEQPFLSVFKKGWRRAPVRNLGKVVHYSKVQLRFQHSQDISDCYLELFPSYLYFQAHGSEGLTFQGLLPLTELSICPIDGSREHAFQITGPLPAPLLVLCHSETELSHWLYHLEKQMALLGLQRCHSALPQGSLGDKHPWTQIWRAYGCESMSNAICASRVKLQHLPSQEQWDRLLVLYPASLVIFSEEPEGLSFKGELPLSAIHINLEEKEKEIRSFLIEGRLINTIRVVCASYEDYSQWLLCLKTVSHRDGAHLLPGSESFPGLQRPTQVVGRGQGSLSSNGRTSWKLECPVFPTSQSLPESSVPTTTGFPAHPVPNQTNSNCVSTGQKKTELRRSASGQSPRGKAQRKVSGSTVPLPLHLDLTKMSVLNLDSGPEAQDHSLDIPHSPLYADPYTPPATSHRKITDIQGLDEQFLCAIQTSPGPELSSPFPSVSVSVPVSDSSSGISSSPRPLGSHLLSKKGALPSRASQRHRGSIKSRGPQPSDFSQLVTPAREGTPSSLPPPPDEEAPIWNKTSSPSHQKWSQPRKPAVEGGFIQWI
ncbi:pleckstrin homology domain-containing family N member 1 isoform X1 [Arvicanthis niloticus]|uniref:pleckstrin homology domain-containing family N member 1 isoform X1 n=1 Tax=Arvicanthis niloticus TaxID=61156 RepID=UPI0014860905|nr:pleckstrin homology domain-containing family N member 1 isoform X1 [Arvicanthis niloticus]